MSYIKTFSAKKMIEPIGSVGRRQPRNRAVNPVCSDWSGIVNLSIIYRAFSRIYRWGNLSVIYRRFPEIYRKNGNLPAGKSSDVGDQQSSRNRQVKHGESSIWLSREDAFYSPNLDSSSLNLNPDRSNPANRNHKMFFAKKWIESISLAMSRRGQGRNTCYVLAHPPLGGSNV